MTSPRPVTTAAVLFASIAALTFGTAATAADTTSAEAPEADGDSLSEVVVSAAKREGTVHNTPVSISVVGDAQIAAMNLNTIPDIQHTMPNLGFALVTGTPQLYIRGVGGGGRNIGFEPRVGVYVDGVYMGNTASLDSVLVGLERVEVLRGPQGFLFGAASDAGAISLVTKAPSNIFSEEATIAYGTHKLIDFTDRINVPLNDNMFATFSVIRDTADGFVRNLAQDGRYVDQTDNIAVRGRLRIVASESTTVDIAADWQHTETGILVGEPLTGPFGTGTYPGPKYTVDQTSPEFDKKSGGGISATVNYADQAVHFTSITAYRTSQRQWDTDTDHTPLDLVFVDYRDRYNTFSQEFTLASSNPDSRLRYLTGLYYSQMTASSNRDLDILKDATAIGLGGGYLRVVPSVLSSTYSAYGSLDFDILPKLTFDVGGRVTLDTRQLTESQAATPDYTLISVPSIVGFVGNHTETYFLPTAGLNYKPTDNLMLYAKYSAGQKPGGYNADFVQDIDPGKVPYQYSAEKVKSYEIGAKSDLLDRRLTANIAGFLNNFKDFQLYQFGKTPSGAIYTALVNAGEVRTYGVETEFKARPITGLDLGLSFSRLFATYTSFPNGGGIGINYDGHQLEYAPKWTGAANADYTHDLNLLSGGYWILGTNFYMRSASYADASNSASYHLSASKLLGARVGIGAKGPGTFEWEVTFSGENLLNSDALTNISDDGLGVLVGFRETPRRYLGKVSIKF